MKLEQQVVSLDLTKRMKELGAPQESIFWHIGVKNDVDETTWDIRLKGPRDTVFGIEVSENIPAYTVAELGEMLPEGFTSSKRRQGMGYECFLFQNNPDMSPVIQAHQYADTEADARAKMWIYLKENKLI